MLGISTPALACQRDPPDIVGYPSAIFIAGKMMEAASFVDVALAEARRPLRRDDPGGFVDSVTFRTIKRLKGASSDRFTLFAPAERRSDFKDSEEVLEHVVDELGRVEPSWGRQEIAYPPRSVPGSPPPPPPPCGPGPITPEVGKLYIVFRDATGRALRTAVYHDAKPATTFPVVAANYSSWVDWWRLGVAQAATKWKPQEAAQQPAAGPRRDDVAKLLLRSPLTAREARKLLDGARARRSRSRLPPASSSMKPAFPSPSPMRSCWTKRSPRLAPIWPCRPDRTPRGRSFQGCSPTMPMPNSSSTSRGSTC